MTEQTMTEQATHTLEVPGAVLTYDVRRSAAADGAVLLLIGSPMGAAGFDTLAGYFPDRTVVTYDPRGVERSRRTDGAATTTPEEHADDLSRLIAALDAGPVDLFASSGGAINALALVARHPEQVRTLVAHEPPAAALRARPRVRPGRVPGHPPDLPAQRDGPGDGQVHRHRLPQGPGHGRLPRPARTGPGDVRPAAEDDGSRDDVLLGQNLVSCTHYEPDVDALRAASTRVVLAAGEESDGELANRGAHAVAERLGTAPVAFPDGHGGFLGGEYGQTGAPEPFAARLREVLDGE